jgi:CBS domain-containing protein
MHVREVCKQVVVFAYRSMALNEAARLMREHHVGSLVVVEERDAGKSPIGMLTDRDIAIDVVALGMDPDSVRVGDVMRKKPVTIRHDLGLFDAAKVFAKTGVRRLPVVDKGGALVGVIAIDDIMMLLGNEMGHVAGALSAGLRKAS